MDNKKELIKQLVDNYYKQVAIVKQTSLTLEEYLKGIFEFTPDFYTDDDLQYGLSLERK